jgi:hypothetical protein
MNIPATFDPICFSGSLEEDWNVYGRTDNGCQVMAIAHLTLGSGELKIIFYISSRKIELVNIVYCVIVLIWQTIMNIISIKTVQFCLICFIDKMKKYLILLVILTFFLLISVSDVVITNQPDVILKMIGQCDVKHIIKTTSLLKVKTYFINIIKVCPFGLAAILVIMFVLTLITAVISYLLMICIFSLWYLHTIISIIKQLAWY